MSQETKDRVVRMLKARAVDQKTRDDAIEAAMAAYAAKWSAQAENALDCAAELAGVDERTPVEPRKRKEKAAAAGGGES